MQEQAWVVAQPAPDTFFRTLAGYPPQMAQVLWNRGFRDEQAVQDLLAFPDIARLPDPFLFTDMEQAVARLGKARERDEHVVVFGDYDADGACGAAVLMELMKQLRVRASVYLPDRLTEGRGITEVAVPEMTKRGAGLVLTVDCGISNVQGIAALKERGIDTVVLDHHLAGDVLPPAVAIVDAHRPEDQYPFDWLCGAGVAFAFVDAALRRFGDSKVPDGARMALLDLVAIATIADLVPLIGPNRILVQLGLGVLEKTERSGIRALLDLSRRGRRGIDADTVAFELAPRINSASRMDHANTAFSLLTAEDEPTAVQLAKILDRHNRARQKQVASMIVEAEAEITELPQLPDVLVIGRSTWSSGLLFGVASRLAERYRRPTFAFAVQKGLARGSARSIPGFDLVAAMRACGGSELFEEFGGHAAAAGGTLRAEWLPLFQERVESYAKEYAGAAVAAPPILNVDIELAAHEISPELFSWFERLAPFGKGNLRPRVLLRDVVVMERKVTERGKKVTLRLTGQHGGRVVTAVVPSAAAAAIREGDRLDMVGEMRREAWGRGNIVVSALDVHTHPYASV